MEAVRPAHRKNFPLGHNLVTWVFVVKGDLVVPEGTAGVKLLREGIQDAGLWLSDRQRSKV